MNGGSCNIGRMLSMERADPLSRALTGGSRFGRWYFTVKKKSGEKVIFCFSDSQSSVILLAACILTGLDQLECELWVKALILSLFTFWCSLSLLDYVLLFLLGTTSHQLFTLAHLVWSHRHSALKLWYCIVLKCYICEEHSLYPHTYIKAIQPVYGKESCCRRLWFASRCIQ